MELCIIEGYNPVSLPTFVRGPASLWFVIESGCLKVQPEHAYGGIHHRRLNTRVWRPIAYKYREGKMQRTLRRELKELEIVGREANDACVTQRRCGRCVWPLGAGRGARVYSLSCH